ncbi:PTS system, N-acetylglucosamine-specific IIBC component [Aggregatibacter aphrophilus]|uniref:PTS system, N-acetylglucosamine-specific IIBC component n=1 Tax=Aggregatibacter aphrophilus TaxID=732 RepID=A0A336N8W6_AGGAP|nr:PTS system, N-acetylglucosamine-specific IIBC component [Aggregatibacter aphrophilus]
MSVLSYAQKIGQALMVPVAVLPAAAVLMGIGYWLDPDGWGRIANLPRCSSNPVPPSSTTWDYYSPWAWPSVYPKTNMAPPLFPV